MSKIWKAGDQIPKHYHELGEGQLYKALQVVKKFQKLEFPR